MRWGLVGGAWLDSVVLSLAQIGGFEPGSRGMERFLLVPGTIRGHCSWHNSPLLCQEQPMTTGFPVVYLVQDPVFVPGTIGWQYT